MDGVLDVFEALHAFEAVYVFEAVHIFEALGVFGANVFEGWIPQIYREFLMTFVRARHFFTDLSIMQCVDIRKLIATILYAPNLRLSMS